MFVPWIKHDYSYKLYQHINSHSCKISICKFMFSPCGLWSISYLIRQANASNDIQPRLHPTCWYYTRSLLQILWTSRKNLASGLWLTVNIVCGPPDEGFPTVLMSAVTGCKLVKLSWNKIEHQDSFFQYFFHFYPISGIHWTLKNVISILAFRGHHENMISLLFH